MHHIAGHDRPLAARENIDTAMMRRVARGRRQRNCIVQRVIVVDEQCLPGGDDGQAIVAKHGARRIIACFMFGFPGGVFLFVKNVLRIWKRGHPTPVFQGRIPAGVVYMQMGAEYVVDGLEGHTQRE